MGGEGKALIISSGHVTGVGCVLLEDRAGCVGLVSLTLGLAHSRDLINVGSLNVGALRNDQQLCVGGGKRRFTEMFDLGLETRRLSWAAKMTSLLLKRGA